MATSGFYYVGIDQRGAGIITGYTAQFTFQTASPDNYADFGVVMYWGATTPNGAHGTPEDPNNPNVITWDASHQIETITVPITQFNVNEQIASLVLPAAGVTYAPQITFLSISTGPVNSTPEPGTV